MSAKPIKTLNKMVGIYRIHENGEMQLIKRVTSPFEAIDIAAEYSCGIAYGTMLIRSEPEEADTEK